MSNVKIKKTALVLLFAPCTRSGNTRYKDNYTNEFVWLFSPLYVFDVAN